MAERRRLDLALISRTPGLSRRKARDVIEKGQVRVDGRTVTEPGHGVAADATIHWDPNLPAQPRARLALPILHRDASVLVVDKPAGLLSVPTPGGAAEATALGHVRDFARRLGRRAYAGAVHRLDRDTSGALAFALSPEAHSLMREAFRAHRIERRYLALVRGSPADERGTVDKPIRDAHAGGRRGLARAGEPSRPALTRYRVVERLGPASLLELELETGRQHQIRLHLASIGHPVLGDRVYGEGRDPVAAARQMLHARLLAFPHPETGRAVRVESPLPRDFAALLARLRRQRAQRDRATVRRGP
jgi:23S rRNA pseudouridine1911/1915/1917 synthase